MDEGMFVRKFAMVCNNCVCVCVYNDTGKFPQTWRGELIGVYNLIIGYPSWGRASESVARSA